MYNAPGSSITVFGLMAPASIAPERVTTFMTDPGS